MIGMNEVEVGARRQLPEKNACRPRRCFVPADVRQPDGRRFLRKADDLAVEPAEALLRAAFEPAAGHELHAQADAEDRDETAPDRLVEGSGEAGFPQTANAFGKSADAGQDQAIRGRQFLRGAQNGRIGAQRLQRVPDGEEIAHAVVDNAHHILHPVAAALRLWSRRRKRSSCTMASSRDMSPYCGQRSKS